MREKLPHSEPLAGPDAEFALQQALPAGADAEWQPVPYLPGDEIKLARGRDLYAKAVMLEGLRGSVTPDVAEEYRRAVSDLISGGSVAPNDPARLIMIGNSLGKQAEADEVAPYEGDQYKSGLLRHLDRRQVLRRRSSDYLNRAVEVISNGRRPTEDEKVRLAASGVVEGKLAAEGRPANPVTIHQNAAELLQSEGAEGIHKILEEYIGQTIFSVPAGKVILEGLEDLKDIKSAGEPAATAKASAAANPAR